MSTKLTVSVKSYSELLSQIRKIFIDGMQKIEMERVKAYWRTGEIISNYILENKERADYGDNLFEKLSGDLGVDDSEIARDVTKLKHEAVPKNS